MWCSQYPETSFYLENCCNRWAHRFLNYLYDLISNYISEITMQNYMTGCGARTTRCLHAGAQDNNKWLPIGQRRVQPRRPFHREISSDQRVEKGPNIENRCRQNWPGRNSGLRDVNLQLFPNIRGNANANEAKDLQRFSEDPKTCVLQPGRWACLIVLRCFVPVPPWSRGKMSCTSCFLIESLLNPCFFASHRWMAAIACHIEYNIKHRQPHPIPRAFIQG
jgi:hypothetical protein